MRSTQNTIVFLVLAGMLSVAPVALGKFDQSTLNTQNKDEEIKELQKKIKTDPKQNKVKMDMTLQEDPKKLETQIKALNLIIKTERDRNKKVDLYLRKSYFHVSVAKMLGLNRQKNSEITPQERFHLDESLKILNFLAISRRPFNGY